MKPKTFDAATIPEEKILLADKLRYEKDGTSIVSMRCRKNSALMLLPLKSAVKWKTSLSVMENLPEANGEKSSKGL